MNKVYEKGLIENYKEFYELSTFQKLKWTMVNRTPEMLVGIIFLPFTILYFHICTNYCTLKENKIYRFENIWDKKGKEINL